MNSFTISRLANEAGVGIETVRYYQRRGLLDLPLKPARGGFRRYTEEDVARIHFIKRAQLLGFTLAEIAQLAPHIEADNCPAAQAIAEMKLHAIEAQLAALEEIRTALKNLIRECAKETSLSCPIKTVLLPPRRDSFPTAPKPALTPR